jgi:HAD superfamily hydrolase (TIGR01544 family)
MSCVHVRDQQGLEKKLGYMANKGLSELQIVADFDGTLTFHMSRNQPSLVRGLSCHGVIGKHPGFSEEYRNEVQRMEDYFAPLERDPTLDDVSRLKVMTDWWSRSHSLMLAQNISIHTVDDMVIQAYNRGMFGLRDRASDFLSLARQFKIPTLVLSAGISIVIEELFKHQKLPVDDLTVIVANQTIASSEGILQSFVEPVIHGMSKKIVLKEFIDESITRRERKNYIVLGDMPHDAEVLKSIENIDCVISVGFLLDSSQLEAYMQLYDIVITEDGTFQPIIDLIERINQYSHK